MSRRLPQLTAREVIRALERAGFFIERSSGSHHLLLPRTDARRRTTVAYHAGKDIPRGTVRHILRQAQLTVDEFSFAPLNVRAIGRHAYCW
jgi:predicted RNA binding protein YcfA (HicA-like mRNA interferase family)